MPGAMATQKEDLAMIYGGKLLETRTNIEQLKEIGMNQEELNNWVDDVEIIVQAKIEECYKSFNKNKISTDESVFYETRISDIYKNAIEELNKFNSILSAKWNKYVQIINTCTSLKNEILDSEKINIDTLVIQALNLLDAMKTSSTISFDIEKNIIDTVYNVVYCIMEYEIATNNTTTILDAVKANETDTAYIAKVLRNELEDVDNNEIRKLIESLKTDGMQLTNLLDKRLIAMITSVKRPELLKEMVSKYIDEITNLKELNNEVDAKTYEFETKEEYEKKSVKSLNKIEKEIKKKKNHTIIAALILSLGLSGGAALAKWLGKTPIYPSVTTTYDSSTGEITPKEFYSREKDNTMTITEKTPWIASGSLRDNGYERIIYTYEIPSEDISLFEDLKDYLNEEMRGKFTYHQKSEFSKELPEDYELNENKYIVERTIKDTEHPEKEPNQVYFLLIFAVTTFGTIVIDTVYLVKHKDRSYSVLKRERLQELEYFEDIEKTVDKLKENLNNALNKKEALEKEVKDKEVIISAALKANPELLDDLSDSDKEKLEQVKALTKGQYKL